MNPLASRASSRARAAWASSGTAIAGTGLAWAGCAAASRGGQEATLTKLQFLYFIVCVCETYRKYAARGLVSGDRPRGLPRSVPSAPQPLFLDNDDDGDKHSHDGSDACVRSDRARNIPCGDFNQPFSAPTNCDHNDRPRSDGRSTVPGVENEQRRPRQSDARFRSVHNRITAGEFIQPISAPTVCDHVHDVSDSSSPVFLPLLSTRGPAEIDAMIIPIACARKKFPICTGSSRNLFDSSGTIVPARAAVGRMFEPGLQNGSRAFCSMNVTDRSVMRSVR